jgi:hypothetical protein
MSEVTKEVWASLAFKTLAVVGLACFLVSCFASRSLAGGFVCGATSFCFSAMGLERLTTRIIQIGQVAQGVRSGIFWLFFKFLAPAATIFFGLSRGYSPGAIVLGIVTALVVFSAVLWFSRNKNF